MTQVELPNATSESIPPPAEAGVIDRRALKLEIGAVLALAAVPDLLHALAPVFLPELLKPRPVGLQAAMILARSIQVALPLLYIMWRSGRGWAFFGWTRMRWFDPLLGAGFLAASYAAYYVVAMGVSVTGSLGFQAAPARERLFEQPHDAMGWLLAATAATLNGFTEELALRAYLIPRLRQLWGSPVLAILASSGVFASYHIYYGIGALLPIAAMGFVMGLGFCATRRLWPVAICHMLADFVPYLLRA